MIPVYDPYFNGKESEYVNQCLQSTWISSKGDFIDRFERNFANYVGVQNSVSVCNGTVAIHLALAVLGIGPGDEVIVPTLTYVASVNPILQVGATPVFVDSGQAHWQVDLGEIKSHIGPHTRAVIVPHLYGHPADMQPIVDLCRRHNLFLIEDCAEAFGTLYRGKHVGTFGDIGTFSFFGNKTITTGEGGMLIFSNPLLREAAYHLKNQGVSKDIEYWHDRLAFNYRMTNICAAIGVAQLETADTVLQKKRSIAQSYSTQLAGLPLTTQGEADWAKNSYWMNSIILNDPSLRAPLREHLKYSGIETRPFFPPVHKMPHLHSDLHFPTAEFLSSAGINLPSSPKLTDEEIDFICKTVRYFFEKQFH